jgi:molybdopterin converting factor small subunit
LVVGRTEKRIVVMAITVEFFGIPRARTGVAMTTADGKTLGEVLVNLAGRFPEFARTCIEENRLRLGYVANIGGDRFVTDPTTPLADDTALLILYQDAGG